MNELNSLLKNKMSDHIIAILTYNNQELSIIILNHSILLHD